MILSENYEEVPRIEIVPPQKMGALKRVKTTVLPSYKAAAKWMLLLRLDFV